MFAFFRRKELERLARLNKILDQRLKLATSSLQKISEGSFTFNIPSYDLTQLDDDGKTFYATLGLVKNKLEEYGIKEKERQWTAEGMNKFMLILSESGGSENFYDTVLKFLVQYSGANQGGIFLLNDPAEGDDDATLQLIAAYAYNKKKHIEKHIRVGQGILGQCFLEKQTTYLTQIPSDYIKITSGLGEATPSVLLMVPIKYNEEVLGIIELAYFSKVEPYQINFLEKVCENIASATLTLRHSKRAERLFQESQEKAKILQEQEETLKQNVEELIATQEEMKRQQVELRAKGDLMKVIIDNIPFPIFVKDELGRYVLVNKAESKLFALQDTELIGKDDSAFVSKSEEWEVIKRSDEKVLASNEPVELPLQHFTTPDGNTHIFKTTKIPFINAVSQKKNILGVSIDLTDKLNLEKRLNREKQLNLNNTFINVAGRQRMLSQKIAFYCESILRGKNDVGGMLKDAIELHEHSLHVLRFGGIPIGVHVDSPLPPLPKQLLSGIDKIERVWEKYKVAAENILYFALTENYKGGVEHSPRIQESIAVIENNGENLLNLNNDFMMEYINYVKTEILEEA